MEWKQREYPPSPKQNIVKMKNRETFNRIDLNAVPLKIIFQYMTQSDTKSKFT